MLSHKELRDKVLADPAVKAEYDRLETEFSLLDELVKEWEPSGLPQAEILPKRGRP